MSLELQIESILFFKSEPMSLMKLAKILEVKETEVKEALSILEKKLQTRGIRLLQKDSEVMLGTAPETSSLIEGLLKEELNKDLGKAGLETLTIVLYKGPITRSTIDYIRGVNSNFILRNLLIRGLVEKTHNPKDQRSFLYSPTFQLLSFLGLSKKEDLPEYKEVTEKVEKFLLENEEQMNNLNE